MFRKIVLGIVVTMSLILAACGMPGGQVVVADNKIAQNAGGTAAAGIVQGIGTAVVKGKATATVQATEQCQQDISTPQATVVAIGQKKIRIRDISTDPTVLETVFKAASAINPNAVAGHDVGKAITELNGYLRQIVGADDTRNILSALARNKNLAAEVNHSKGKRGCDAASANISELSNLKQILIGLAKYGMKFAAMAVVYDLVKEEFTRQVPSNDPSIEFVANGKEISD